MSFSIFDNPTKSEAPRVGVLRRGVMTYLPYDPSLPQTEVGLKTEVIVRIEERTINGHTFPVEFIETKSEPQESQLIYEETSTDLIWLSIEPQFPNHKHFAVSKKGNPIYRNFIPLSNFQ